eukprot:3941626-Rhodomonas_salina.3
MTLGAWLPVTSFAFETSSVGTWQRHSLRQYRASHIECVGRMLPPHVGSVSPRSPRTGNASENRASRGACGGR